SLKNVACQGQIQMSKKSNSLCLVGTLQDISSFTIRTSASQNIANASKLLGEAIARIKNNAGVANLETIALLDEVAEMLQSA
ncbi:MAG: hypothetical protein ACK4ON_05110, partial [Bacteroidia bacterium]